MIFGYIFNFIAVHATSLLSFIAMQFVQQLVGGVTWKKMFKACFSKIADIFFDKCAKHVLKFAAGKKSPQKPVPRKPPYRKMNDLDEYEDDGVVYTKDDTDKGYEGETKEMIVEKRSNEEPTSLIEQDDELRQATPASLRKRRSPVSEDATSTPKSTQRRRFACGITATKYATYLAIGILFVWTLAILINLGVGIGNGLWTASTESERLRNETRSKLLFCNTNVFPNADAPQEYKDDCRKAIARYDNPTFSTLEHVLQTTRANFKFFGFWSIPTFSDDLKGRKSYANIMSYIYTFVMVIVFTLAGSFIYDLIWSILMPSYQSSTEGDGADAKEPTDEEDKRKKRREMQERENRAMKELDTLQYTPDNTASPFLHHRDTYNRASALATS